MKTLETDRLILRAWDCKDLDDLYEYAKDPEVGPSAGWEPHSGRDVSQWVLQSFIERDEVWAIVFRENHRVVGSLGLHADSLREGVNARMIGYVLAREYWGRGLMREAVDRVVQHAFEDLDLDVLSVDHYPFNDRSRRVIEKCGFTREGTLRKAKRRYDGVVLDLVCYSMTREDYSANHHRE